MNRYQIYSIQLDPSVGAEMQKTRPCVIVSPDEMNEHLKTVMIAPITSAEHDLPTRIKIESNDTTGLHTDSFIALDQIKTVDKHRCGMLIGTVSDDEARQISSVLCEIFKY